MPSRRPPRAASLLGAERVVADHRRGLLERLCGRHVEHRNAARQRVRQLVALKHVAAAQLERVDVELAGERSIACSRKYVSICHGPRYGAREHVLVNADCDSNASFGIRYGPVKITAPMAAALPASGYAPTSSRWSAAMPRIVPSASAAR